MTGVGWLALGLGVLLLPVGNPVRLRADTLSADGRLAGLPSRSRSVRVPRPEVAAVAGCLVATVAVGAMAGVVLALAAAIALGTSARLLLVARRRRHDRRRMAELVTALRLLAAELEAGGRPSAAFAAAAAAGAEYRTEFTAAAEAARGGHDPPLDSPDLNGLAHAWAIAHRSGASLAAVVARVADDVAARIDQRHAVERALAGAQSSGALLAGLPVLGLLLGAAMQAHPVHILVSTPAGRVLTLVGVTLDAAGVLWTQRLTSRAERP
jgi:tight adherence protein B